MGVFDKLGRAFGVSKAMDIGEYMESAEMEDVDVLHEPADMYVMPVTIQTEGDVALIEEELSKGNIILLNVDELNKRPNTRNAIVARLKNHVAKINGDIGQISEAKLLLTPKKVKIIKRKKSAK
jgi:SepF-like predicted cell division protein (DUF552 family)